MLHGLHHPGALAKTCSSRIQLYISTCDAANHDHKPIHRYQGTLHWPEPRHRVSALATQGACLILALFWAPQVLHNDTSLMRTLVVRPDRSSC